MCEPYEPPDDGWDTMVPGGTVLILNPLEEEEMDEF